MFIVDISTQFEPAKIFTKFSDLINVLLPNIFILAGLILFVYLIFAGFMIIMGAGSGDEQGITKGKESLKHALIGFILIFSAYGLMQVINFITGINVFQPGF